MMNLVERLTTDGPKRILAIDGGGIRGALALGFLERIEQLLRQRHGRPDLRLRDYFDLIGGTSTGAIIAACLAVGLEAGDVLDRYLRLGGKVFGQYKWKQWQARFNERPLDEELESIFGDMALGDPAITTGLCILTKRADTGSTWPLFNHPGGRFFAANRHIRVRDALRASTAAPVYFMPKEIALVEGEVGTFIDGGVSTANNPALKLFLLATLGGFGLRWPTGEDRLMLVSIGSGSWEVREDQARLAKAKVWDWATRVPLQLMYDSDWQNQLILQYLSRSPTARTIDAEVGDLSGDLLGTTPALHYLRYDVHLEPDALAARGFDGARAQRLRAMSGAENRFELAELGRACAQDVMAEHFPAAFDLERPAP